MQERRTILTSHLGDSVSRATNARSWVHVEVSRDIEIELETVSFITGFHAIRCSAGRVVQAADLDAIPPGCYQVFEPIRHAAMRTLRLREAHNCIRFYTWGDPDFTLAAGTTRATVIDDDRLLRLKPGDILVFEEVLGQASGAPTDADPERRHAVRLTRVEVIADLSGETRELVAIEWHEQDKLPFAMPVSRRPAHPGAKGIDNITVVRANVVLVDAGRTIKEYFYPEEDDRDEDGRRGPGYALRRGPLTFAEPFLPHMSARAAFERDAGLAAPQVSAISIAADDDDHAPPVTIWQPRPSLDASGPADCHFVVSLRDGVARLTFGAGEQGRRPSPGAVFVVTYRVDQGPMGNVGREQIAYMVLHKPGSGDVVIKPRNPFPAQGGANRAGAGTRMLSTVLAGTGCALLAEDYVALAQRHQLVRQAAGWLVPQGTGYLVHIVIDIKESDQLAWVVRQEVEAMLAPYCAPRHVLSVLSAVRVPCAVSLRVHLQKGADRDAVRRNLLDLLGAGMTVEGRPGLFHPDRLRLGQSVTAEAILAVTDTVTGIERAEVVRLARVGGQGGHTALDGLAIGPGELPCLEHHPDRPDSGLFIHFVESGTVAQPAP